MCLSSEKALSLQGENWVANQEESRHCFMVFECGCSQAPKASAEDVAADAESRDFAVAMARVGWETKAEQIRVMHVAPLVYWCSYMVVLNIKSRPQLQAVIAKMERLAEERYGRKISPLADTSR